MFSQDRAERTYLALAFASLFLACCGPQAAAAKSLVDAVQLAQVFINPNTRVQPHPPVKTPPMKRSCAPGQIRIKDLCITIAVPVPVVCAPGTVNVQGRCVPQPCPAGKVRRGAACIDIARPVDCKPGTVNVKGRCVPAPCPAGKVRRGAGCIDIAKPVDCKPGTVMVRGRCTPAPCPAGTARSGAACIDVAQPNICRDGFVRRDGRCVREPCPGGTMREKGRCVPIAAGAPPAVALSPAADQCLPRDLYDLLVATYGAPPQAQPCEEECIPKPAFLTKPIEALANKNGVAWCENCVSLGSFLPLADILKIEKATNLSLCAQPPSYLCQLPARTVVRTSTKVRTLYERLPAIVAKTGDVAVLVGNETYGNGQPANVNGQSDAAAMRALLTEKLGYLEENIIDLNDATRADFERVFGSSEQPRGELARLHAERGSGDVLIYASSHGITNRTANISYLLPVDADWDRPEETAYPLALLYANLERLGARSIMVALEANFNQTLSDVVDPPNLPENDLPVMPERSVPGLVVFKASDRDQRTLEDPEYGIGIFTRYLIESLAGKADEAPTGNADGRIDSVELFVYTAHNVRLAARKSFGMEQKPLVSKIDNLVIGRLAKT